MRLTGGICALALVATTLGLGVAHAQRADGELILRPGAHGTIRSTDVFRVEVSLNGHDLPEEWIAPASGSYSTKVGGTQYWFDGTTALVYARPENGGPIALVHGEHSYVRAQSRADLDVRPGAAIVGAYLAQGAHPKEFTAATHDGHTVLELHASYPYDNGDSAPLSYRVTVTERIGIADARRRGLFASAAKPTSTTWQSGPGAPSRLGLTPYWLGPRSGVHVASMVKETTRTEEDPPSYLVHYVKPSAGCGGPKGTAGRNGWWPGIPSDTCWNWRIVSMAPSSPIRRGDRITRQITLADGTRAELIHVDLYVPFYVRTKDALVELKAESELSVDEQAALARTLRHVQP